MKITFYVEYVVDRHYRDEFDLEISDDEYELVVGGSHSDYDDLEEWARDQELRFDEPSRRDDLGGKHFWEGDSGIFIATKY